MNYSGENKVLASIIIAETTLASPGYSLVRPIWGCTTGQGMFKSLRALTSLVKGRCIDPNLKMTLLLIFHLDICLINVGKEILNPIIISSIM